VDGTKYKGHATHVLTWKRFAILLLFLIIIPLVPLGLPVIFWRTIGVGAKCSIPRCAPLVRGIQYIKPGKPADEFQSQQRRRSYHRCLHQNGGTPNFWSCFQHCQHFSNATIYQQAIKRVIKKGSIIAPFIAFGFVIPLSTALIGGVFGSILSATEGWGVVDGANLQRL
jgi:hypothetical protein